jgi:hypothetical protein
VSSNSSATPTPQGVDQSQDPAVSRMHAATHLEGAELFALQGDADVARHRQLDALAVTLEIAIPDFAGW